VVSREPPPFVIPLFDHATLLDHPFVPQVIHALLDLRPQLVPFILITLREPLRVQLITDYAALTGERREAVAEAWEALMAQVGLPELQRLPEDNPALQRSVYEPQVLYNLWRVFPELGTYLIQVLTSDQRSMAANAVAAWLTLTGTHLTWAHVMMLWSSIPERDEPRPRRRRRAKKDLASRGE
jgi:hypothetical protein